MPDLPRFYFDLASPYAYLTAMRIERLLGPVSWAPILVGALHRHYRRASWGTTAALRAAGVAEIERRAHEYGLPAIVWPTPYPANTLTAMRAATWASGRGAAREFALAAYNLAFGEGGDLTDRAMVLEAAQRAGLDPDALGHALDDPALKLELREANDRAIAAGVYGAPTVDAGGLLWWGDQQLPAAQAAMR